MIASSGPETDEIERANDETRRLLIAHDLHAKKAIPRVALHKLLTEKGDGLHAAFYIADAGQPFYMCALQVTSAREALADVRAWLGGAAGFAPEVALDLKHAELSEDSGMATPWPDRDLLTRLAAAADHLLTVHDCDCAGHEEVRAAVTAARAARTRQP